MLMRNYPWFFLCTHWTGPDKLIISRTTRLRSKNWTMIYWKKLQNLCLGARREGSDQYHKQWVFKLSAKVKSNFKTSISDAMIVFRRFITKLRVIFRETIFLEVFLPFIIRMTWRKQWQRLLSDHWHLLKSFEESFTNTLDSAVFVTFHTRRRFHTYIWSRIFWRVLD